MQWYIDMSNWLVRKIYSRLWQKEEGDDQQKFNWSADLCDQFWGLQDESRGTCLLKVSWFEVLHLLPLSVTPTQHWTDNKCINVIAMAFVNFLCSTGPGTRLDVLNLPLLKADVLGPGASLHSSNPYLLV